MSQRIIRWPELQKKLGGRSRSSIYRDEIAGIFPKRRPLGKHSVGWLEDEIDKWILGLQPLNQTGGRK